MLRIQAISCAVLTTLAAIAAGCGGGSHGASPTASTVPLTTVVMSEFAYTPASLTVPAGTTVTFVNRGKIAHTVADVDARGDIRSAIIKPRPLETGQSQLVTFSKPGTYRYICTFHPTLMRGTVIVTGR